MKILNKLVIIIISINLISSIPVCQNLNQPPENIEVDTSKTINQISYSGKEFSTINIGNQIFLNKNTFDFISSGTTTIYSDSKFCPDDFKIPTQSDYQSLIESLGSDAYSTFTNREGFNMETGKYYLTNTIPADNTDATKFNKMFLYLDGTSFKFISKNPFDSNTGIRCMLDLLNIKLVLPFQDRDLELNEKIKIMTNRNNFINGFLWKVDDQIFKTETIEYTFEKTGGNIIEFWGKYINGRDVYLCDYIYVNKPPIANSQSFDDSKIKTIETNFIMDYSFQITFAHSNFPISPRDDGGYYIAFTDTDRHLHVLSYDKNDNLIKDFNTMDNAYPFDITATNYGFAIYLKEFGSSFHSYMKLYDENFELIKTVDIMNNNPNDDKTVDSNLSKQIIKYDSSGSPVFGMRFMYSPDNGKLIYSRGRIFLIFCHYNYFLDVQGHTGDTIVTFDENLSDMDFGITWGASHSLIQSVTFDDNYFWTAALSDAYPEGIQVEYTSKKDFTNEYDPINQKYNSRVSEKDTNLAGYIKGYHTGPADGKLGGILYFERFNLYCLVYAKTPNYSQDASKNGKHIIFITSWKFEDNKIVNNKTYEIKVFNDNENIMQIRAGKYGNDKIFIIYADTNEEITYNYGNIPKGTKSKVFVIEVPNMNKIINDKAYDNLLMNTNEDLRTFRNGILIWGAANQEGKLVIHKIGSESATADGDPNFNGISKMGIGLLFFIQIILAFESLF